jgi:hypothetical protein
LERYRGLEGAEAILKLRAVIASGDFEDYWRFHLRITVAVSR